MQGFHVPRKGKEHRLHTNPSASPSCPPMPWVIAQSRNEGMCECYTSFRVRS